MRKIILMAVAALMAMSVSAQDTVKKVRVYEGNTIVFEQDYDAVDSVVFVDVEVPSVPDGALVGKFSVSATTQVQFSKGNLCSMWVRGSLQRTSGIYSANRNLTITVTSSVGGQAMRLIM